MRSHHKRILMAGIMADIILFHGGGKIIIALDFTLTVRQPRIILAKWQSKCGIFFTLPVKKNLMAKWKQNILGL